MPRLQVSARGVVKIYSDPNVARQEWLKSLDAEELASESHSFITPRILGHSQTSTKWEYLDDLKPLRVAFAQGPESVALARRVGRVLAEIHNHLGAKHVSSQPDFAADPTRLIHGDFSLNNVQVRGDRQEVVVLDWSLCPWLSVRPDMPMEHLDVAVFLVDLFYQRPRDPLLIRRPANLARAFLAGYCETRNLRFNRLAGDVARVSLQYFRCARQGWRRALRLPSLGCLAFLMLRLSRSGGANVQLP